MPQGQRTVTDDEIIDWVRSHPDPAFTTAEIAAPFDIGTEAMRGRLKSLAEDGHIRMKKPGVRTVIWWADDDHGAEAFSP